MPVNEYNPVSNPVNLALIASLSRSLGRITADNEFYQAQLKAQAQQAAAAKAQAQAQAEESAASQDSGSSHGILGSIADSALGALDWTIDKLSRPLYGVENIYKTAIEDNADQLKNLASEGISDIASKASDGLSFGDLASLPVEMGKLDAKYAVALLPDNPKEIGHIPKAFGRGFAGKDKTTAIDTYIALETAAGAKNPEDYYLPKWLIGPALVQDIGLDPLSYVGVGLVNDAVKGGRALLTVGKDTEKVAQSVKADQEVAQTIEELSNLNLTHDVPQVDVNGVPTGEVIPVQLTKEDIEPLFGIQRSMNGARTQLTQAGRTENFKRQIAVLESIRAQLNDVGAIAKNDEHIVNIDRQIAELRRGTPTDAEMEGFLKETMASELDKMKKSGEFPTQGAQVAHLIGDAVTESVDLKRLTNTIHVSRRLDAARSSLKTAKTADEKARLTNNIAKLESELANSKGTWWSSDVMDPEWRDLNLEHARNAWEAIPGNHDYKLERANVLRGSIRNDYAELKKIAESDPVRAAVLRQNIQNKADLMGQIYARNAEGTADAFSLLMTPHIVNQMIKRGDYQDITRMQSKIDDLTARIAGYEDTPVGTQGIGTLGEGEVGDVVKGLKQDRAELVRQRDDLIKQANQTHSMRKATRTIRKGEPEFAETKRLHIRAAAQKIYESKLQTLRRSKRVGGSDSKAFKGSAGVGDYKPRITLNDGRAVTYDEFLKLPPKERALYVTDKYIQAAPKKGIKTVPHVTKGTSPEKVAFSHLFREQNGMSLQDFAKVAKESKADAAKRVLTLSDGQKYSRTEYGALRAKSPGTHINDGDVALLNGRFITRVQFKLAGHGDDARFNELLTDFARTHPNDFLKNTKDVWDNMFEDIHGKKAPNHWTTSTNETLVSNSEKSSLMAKATKEAEAMYKDTETLVTTPAQVRQAIDITSKPSETVIMEMMQENARLKAAEIANERLLAKAEGRASNEAQITKLYKQRADALTKLQTELRQTQKIMAVRVQEQALINMAQATRVRNVKTLRIRAFGQAVADVPTPATIVKATEKLGGLPILRTAAHAWSEAFRGASGLSRELNLVRLRMQSRTPELVKFRVDELRHDFGGFKPAARKDSFSYLFKGGAPRNELDQKMLDWFDNFSEYLDKVKIGDSTLNYQDINRYLMRDKMQIHKLRGETWPEIGNGADLIKHMQGWRETDDPMQLMWMMSTAVEQAMADKAAKFVIKSTFGVRQGGSADDIVQGLKELPPVDGKPMKWETNKELGNDYLFAPELNDEINKLFKMMQPRETAAMLKMFDKVMNVWRSTVTVYNVPGFYSRNGMGEMIMGAFDGVVNPVWYQKAGRLLRYEKPDTIKESLRQLEPWKHHETQAQTASRPLVTMRSGRQLSTADISVLYHEMGLHTGFISTGWDTYAPSAAGLRATAGGKLATKVNETMRHRSEQFEDYFRMAHFISRMERSHIRDPLAAAQEAAEAVRKYHFDYTDFTPLEKSLMVRVFPFYKWTRKSVPLMLGMLFTKPDKMMLYPKIMQNIAYATGGTDPLTDENGFVPNYDEVVPEWMRKAYSYATGTWGSHDDMVYGNVSTPQFDALKGLADPGNLVVSNLSPAIKVPLELYQGKTLQGGYPTSPVGQYLERQTPQGSLFATLDYNAQQGKYSSWKDALKDPRFLSFLTGLGLYENTQQRQQGEQLRQISQQSSGGG